MRTFKIHIFLIYQAFLSVTNILQAQPCISFSAAGGTANSSNYDLIAVMGQSSPATYSSNSQYGLLSGLLYTMDTNSFESKLATFLLSPGKEAGNYRMISVPAVLQDPDPGKVLVDDFGKYSNVKWRLFDCLDGKKINTEFPNTRALKPGVALFLIIKEIKSIDLEKGSLIEMPNFSIPLHQGWNLIGNPYDFDIPVTNLRFLSDIKATVDIKAYTGNWKSSTAFSPWTGYAISAKNADELIVNAVGTSSNTLQKVTGYSEQKRNGWKIQISATCGNLSDEENFVGLCELASEQCDNYDRFEPPAMGDYVSLSFPHPDWSTFLTDLEADYRPLSADGHTWDIRLQSNVADRTVLSFSGIANVPAQNEVYLLDPATNVAINLRKNNEFETVTNTSPDGRLFQLVVGGSAYADDKIKPYQALPMQYALRQNFPNPFNPSTTILFELPKAGNVNLVVKNILGQEVATLCGDRYFGAGRHALIWDARNTTGERVSCGEYFYQIRAGDWQAIKNMVLLQ